MLKPNQTSGPTNSSLAERGKTERTAIQQEIVDLIRFYEKRGSDWTVAAEFTLARHSGNLERIVRPWGWQNRPMVGRPRKAGR